MKKFLLIFIFCFFAVFAKNAVAQNISNEGMEFWTVFPTHDPYRSSIFALPSLATMNINITSKSDSEVTVSCGTWSSLPTFIEANTVVTFLVPRVDSYIASDEANNEIINKGIHIVVTPGKPKVVAYSHVYAAARSAATLILPIESLGQKYFSMNYTQDGNGRNFLVCIAVEDNTSLILNKTNGSKVPIFLPHKGDVYEYLSLDREDLTGTFVEVDPEISPCKRFAAFSGSTSVAIGCSNGRDPLLQQLYAINSWGKTYGIVPFFNKRYIVRVLAQEDNTIVALNGSRVIVLNKGEYYEQTLSNAAIISADKLISVAQYSYSQNCSSINGGVSLGDPEMVLLNPIEFNIKDITVFSSSKESILNKYINVFMRTDKTKTFRLNGALPNNGIWRPMPSDPTYSYLQMEVFAESLKLTADVGFNAIAYGFGDVESYAYSAGTNLASSSSLVFLNTTTGSTNLTACLGQQNDFKLSVPYELSKITWTFNDGSTYIDFPLVAPVVTTDPIGSSVFTYTSPVAKTFNSVEKTTIKANAVVKTTNNNNVCFDGADLEFNFEIEVTALAFPDFDKPTDICLGAPITIIDKSTGPISKWKWEFDGDVITVQNPTYNFTDTGSHTIKLSVANESGCWSDIISKEINIYKYLPVINFEPLNPICINDAKKQLVALETLGLNASEQIFSGNGISPEGLFDPSAAGAGKHLITYKFTSTDGCINTVTQEIEVYALPKISIIPIIYILAGGQKEIPTVILNPDTKYTYKWTPSIGLDKDDVLNPIASPEIDTKYQLTVSIDGMCDVISTVLVKVLQELKPPNTFTPNGDGINDTWNIQSIDSYPDATVEVLNRNGQKVFSSIGYKIPFDGSYRNNPLPVGVYYYIINPKNGRKPTTGSLTIIR